MFVCRCRESYGWIIKSLVLILSEELLHNTSTIQVSSAFVCVCELRSKIAVLETSEIILDQFQGLEVHTCGRQITNLYQLKSVSQKHFYFQLNEKGSKQH